jgi:site-specific DNA-methyltransferase (adenine-specific)
MTTPTTVEGTPYLGTYDLPVTDLVDWPGNARVHDQATLDESVTAYGQYRAVLGRQLPDGRVQLLAGHGTKAALARAGYETVTVEVRDVPDDAAARRIVLMDNRSNDRASYDERALLALLDQAHADGGLGGSGFDAAAYEALLASVGSENPHDWDPAAGDAADDTDPTPPDDPVTVLGDVWILGGHRLVCGDSTLPAVWETLLGGGSVDCLWTDPPYGVAYVGKTRDALTIENDNLDEAGLERLLRAALGHAWANAKPGAAWHVAAPPGPLHAVFLDALRALGGWRQTIIWVKDQFVLGHSDYHWRHEPIFIGYVPGGKGRPGRGGTSWYGGNAQDSVWEIPRPKRSEDHPTMKPLELVARAIRNSTRKGAIVADPFCGSGTTLLACEITGRSGRGIELDPRYCDVTARRWQELTGELPYLERLAKPVDLIGRNA